MGRASALLALLTLAAAPYACGAEFTPGDPDTTLAGTPSGTTTTGTGNGGAAATGGTGPTGGGGAGGTATVPCDHDACDLGEALESACDGCVDSVCDHRPTCCTDDWTAQCVYDVLHRCGQECSLTSCMAQYGAGTGYLTCDKTADKCTFRVQLGSSTCAAFCAQNGGECIQAYGESSPCVTSDEAECITPIAITGFTICECSRGCGDGPPCTNMQVCVGGQCQGL